MENNHIDVEYSEVKEEKEKPIYVSLSEVAKMIGEPDSTVRLWCNSFEDVLKIERSGRNRMFKQSDIDNIKIIQTLLREKGFSHQQVLEKLKEEENGSVEVALTKEDPLAIQALAVALTNEINKNLTEMLRETFVKFAEREEEIQKQNQQQINELKSTIEKLTEKIYNQNKSMDEKELEAKNRDMEIIELLKTRQEERKSSLNENKSNIFSKLFGKK